MGKKTGRPRGGSKPGERRGGRGKGIPNLRRQPMPLDDPRSVALLEAASRRPVTAEACKDLLAEFANFYAGMARQFKPSPNGKHGLLWRGQDDEPLFLKYSQIAGMFAGRAAPYESPTFKAIMMAPPPDAKPGDNVREMRLTIFDSSGNRVQEASEDIEDAVVVSRMKKE